MDFGEGFARGVRSAVLIILSCVTFWWIASSYREQWEKEAVRHNAATWTVDENGNRVFKWKGE